LLFSAAAARMDFGRADCRPHAAQVQADGAHGAGQAKG